MKSTGGGKREEGHRSGRHQRKGGNEEGIGKVRPPRPS